MILVFQCGRRIVYYCNDASIWFAPSPTVPLYRRAVLIAIIALQLIVMARVNSCTWDEADHTYAGYMQWKHGDFGLNSEHPPLVKFVATLPLLGMRLKMPPLQDRFYRLQEAEGGRDFVFANDANKILFRIRMAVMSFALLLASLSSWLLAKCSARAQDSLHSD